VVSRKAAKKAKSQSIIESHLHISTFPNFLIDLETSAAKSYGTEMGRGDIRIAARG
jgi:hypothetical protein